MTPVGLLADTNNKFHLKTKCAVTVTYTSSVAHIPTTYQVPLSIPQPITTTNV